MSLHRRAARRDANEKAITDALRAIGATIYKLSGKGLPDLLIERGGVWRVCEVKSTHGRFTKAQKAARVQEKWPVIRSVAEGLALFTRTEKENDKGARGVKWGDSLADLPHRNAGDVRRLPR